MKKPLINRLYLVLLFGAMVLLVSYNSSHHNNFYPSYSGLQCTNPVDEIVRVKEP